MVHDHGIAGSSCVDFFLFLLYSNHIRIEPGSESKRSFRGIGVNFQGPVNFVTLQSVTPVLRPLSMAMSTVVIHVFGDVPSAPIVGAFQVSCMVALFFLPVPVLLH
jgi:hypothetical protein